MRKYQYLVLPECYEAIYAFYYHVALKYRHTYSEEMMQQNIDDAADAFYRIEKLFVMPVTRRTCMSD